MRWGEDFPFWTFGGEWLWRLDCLNQSVSLSQAPAQSHSPAEYDQAHNYEKGQKSTHLSAAGSRQRKGWWTWRSALLHRATRSNWSKASLVRPFTSSQLGDSGINLDINLFLSSFLFSAQCSTHFHPARMGRIARAAVSERSLQEGMSMATQGRVSEARV